MKIKVFVSLLAVLLMLLPLGALAESEAQYRLGPSSMIVTEADDCNIVFITGSIQNTSDQPIFVGYGSCDMFDKEGNLLCTTSARCVPMQLKPNQMGFFRADLPSFEFSNPEAEVTNYTFRFEPFIDDGPGYTLLTPSVSYHPDVRVAEGCPVTLTIHNTTGKAIEDFDVCVSLWYPSDIDPNVEQIYYMPEPMLFYNRIPAGGTVDVKLYIPDSVMEALAIGWPKYSIHGLVAIPD